MNKKNFAENAQAVAPFAVALDESLGFRRIEAYRHNPLVDVVYMELALPGGD